MQFRVILHQQLVRRFLSIQKTFLEGGRFKETKMCTWYDSNVKWINLIDLFTDTASILNLLDLRSIMGCSRGMSMIRFTRSVYIRALLGPTFLQFFLEKDCNRKKDRCAAFGCNNDRLFSENYTVKFYFCPKSPGNVWLNISVFSTVQWQLRFTAT